MKRELIFIPFLLLFVGCRDILTANKSLPLTAIYAGTYSCRTNSENGAIGTLIIFPETDTTVLFYMDLNNGAPAYNMGSLYGRLEIIDSSGTFNQKYYFSDYRRRFIIEFSGNSIMIIAVDYQCGCGFGHSVYADGVFERLSAKIPEYFDNGSGKKVFFGKTATEDYYKN